MAVRTTRVSRRLAELNICRAVYSSLQASRSGKVAVVIGGCGFLGRHLVEGLVERGYSVRVFDLHVSFNQEGVEFYTGNLCKKEVS